MKSVLIGNNAYCLSTFAKEYGFSYSTVRSYYHKGYRNLELLNVLNSNKNLDHKPIKFKGKIFKSKLQAANYFDIPTATFYRYAKRDKLSQLEKFY